TRATTSRGKRRVTKAAIRQPAAIFGSMPANSARSLLRMAVNFSSPSRKYTISPAVNEIAAITAVDHSNDLIRRRSAMKSRAYDGGLTARILTLWLRAFKWNVCAGEIGLPLTQGSAAVSVCGDGDGVPRNRPQRLMTPTESKQR